MRDAVDALLQLLTLEVEEAKKGVHRSIVVTLVVSLFCATSYVFLTLGAYLVLLQIYSPSLVALLLASANMLLASLSIVVFSGLKRREKRKKAAEIKTIIQSLSPRSYALAVIASAIWDRKKTRK